MHFVSQLEHKMTVLSGGLSQISAWVCQLLITAGLKLLIVHKQWGIKKKNHNFPHHNTLRINRADFWWQTNHQRVILKDIDCDTLLAEAPALYFSSLIVVARERDKKRQSDTARAESTWISAPDDRSSLCLRNTAEIRLGKRVNAAVRKRCRQ